MSYVLWVDVCTRFFIPAFNVTGFIADTDMVVMFDEAYRRQPNNEELGAQDFFANVRTGNWKSAQQVRRFSRICCADCTDRL